VTVSVSLPLPEVDQAAVTGIDLQFVQRPTAAQELDLVHPAAVLALQLNLHDLPGVVAFEAIENRPQGQDLPRLQRLARAVVVVIFATPVAAGDGRSGAEDKQQRCAGEGGIAATAAQSSIPVHGKLAP
jgi:hypothetical protein